MSDPQACSTLTGSLNLGSEAIGLPIACALWGATCVQLFLYFIHHSNPDSKLLKFVAIWTWAMDTAHMIAALQGFYSLFAKHWGDAGILLTLNTGYVWSLFFTTLTSCSTQLFFTYRLWILSGHNWLFVIFFVPLAIAQPVLLLAFSILCYQNTTTNSILYALQDLPIAAWSISAGLDILISASLLYFIWKYRSQTLVGFSSSHKILDRIIVLTINTGIWTAIVSLLTMSLLVALPENGAFTAVSFLMGPLYCNMLLANLNSRGYIRDGNGGCSDISFDHCPFVSSGGTQTSTQNANFISVNLKKNADDSQNTAIHSAV